LVLPSLKLIVHLIPGNCIFSLASTSLYLISSVLTLSNLIYSNHWSKEPHVGSLRSTFAPCFTAIETTTFCHSFIELHLDIVSL
jgi:hypothetical protein